MGRPFEPEKKAALREAVADYVVARGLEDLSLRPLAKAVGTSARMLLYHFGSREALVREALQAIREREDSYVRAWWERESRGPRPLSAFVRSYWERLSTKQAEPVVRFLFEAYGMAMRRPSRFAGLMRVPLDYWGRLVARSHLVGSDEATATLILAVIRGLLLDLLASGDRPRLRRALDHFVQMIEPSPPPAKRGRGRTNPLRSARRRRNQRAGESPRGKRSVRPHGRVGR